jgi:hypothetical protein
MWFLTALFITMLIFMNPFYAVNVLWFSYLLSFLF